MTRTPAMSRTPAVSVVIPSYNHAAFIEAAVDSALASAIAATGDDFELVIVDDGSTDDSRARLERFRADPRVSIYAQENRGADAALNRGIAASRGEIVFILNSDDLFGRQRIKRFLKRFANDPQLATLTSWLEVIDADGGSLGIKEAWHNMPPWPRPRPGPGLAATGDPLLALLETNYVSTTSNLAFRRKVFDGGTNFLPLRYAHDWEFILAASEHGRPGLIEEPLVSYRVHAANTISEGRRQARAEGRMRFEILWVVARHAARLLHDKAIDGAADEYTAADLWRRFWNSAPRFGYRSILSRLLALRGGEARPPAAYDALLDEDHPFRRRAVAVLGGEA